MGHDIDYKRLPAHIRSGVRDYIERGHLPGDFLRAVISNNLSQSFGYADEINRARLFKIVSFFHNEVPGPCWGSVDKMHAWAAQGGLSGEMASDLARKGAREEATRKYIDEGNPEHLKEALKLAGEDYAKELEGR
jgi:hypothetical protein